MHRYSLRSKAKPTSPTPMEIDSPPSTPAPPPPPPPEPEIQLPDFSLLPPPTYATRTATKALHNALKDVLEYQEKTRKVERGWVVDLEGISNLYQWTVRLTDFEETLPLQRDLRSKGIADQGVVLEVRFGPDFPTTPPYIRVIRPRLLQFINGGGGHVTAGGSICLEILTSTGWKKDYSLPSIFLEVRLAITSLEPQPARLDMYRGWNVPYSAQEAMSAYVRVARDHGWRVPNNWTGLFMH